MQQITFQIPGRAQQRGSKRPVRNPKTGRILLIDSNHRSKSWMENVRDHASILWGDRLLLDIPVQLTAQFYFKRPRSHFGTGRNAGKLKSHAPMHHGQSPDLAKLLRSLEDGITGAIWMDDKLVSRYGPGTGRYWTTGQERTFVQIDSMAEVG